MPYDYAATATRAPTYPSVAKAIWDRMAILSSFQGLSGLFYLFHQALGLEIYTCSANEDINQINSFFEQMTSTGLDLPDSFHAEITNQGRNRNPTKSDEVTTKTWYL